MTACATRPRRSVARPSSCHDDTSTSASSEATIVYRPQLCVYSSTTLATTKPTSARCRRSTNAPMNVATTTSTSTTTSVYMRVSWAKYARNGDRVTRIDTVTATRRPPTRAPAHHATGIAASANTSDIAWVATSLVPNSSTQPCSARYQTGGDPSWPRLPGMSRKGCSARPMLRASSIQYQVPRAGSHSRSPATMSPSTMATARRRPHPLPWRRPGVRRPAPFRGSRSMPTRPPRAGRASRSWAENQGTGPPLGP